MTYDPHDYDKYDDYDPYDPYHPHDYEEVSSREHDPQGRCTSTRSVVCAAKSEQLQVGDIIEQIDSQVSCVCVSVCVCACVRVRQEGAKTDGVQDYVLRKTCLSTPRLCLHRPPVTSLGFRVI